MRKFIRCPYCKYKLVKHLEAVNSIGGEIYCWRCTNCDAYFTEDSPVIMSKTDFRYVGGAPKMEACELEEAR